MTSYLRRAAWGALLLAALSASPGLAQTPGERLFYEGALREVATGAVLIYEHRREGTQVNEQTPLLADGEIKISLRLAEDGSREAVAAMSGDGALRQLNAFPASAGNPLLLVFLESSLRSMAGVTGGSVYYIRNRMKEALYRGGAVSKVEARFGDGAVEAEEIVFRPFTTDKNRHRMGDFADLELRFLLAPDAPGGFLLFSAETPDRNGERAFREQISFSKIEVEG